MSRRTRRRALDRSIEAPSGVDENTLNAVRMILDERLTAAESTHRRAENGTCKIPSQLSVPRSLYAKFNIRQGTRLMFRAPKDGIKQIQTSGKSATLIGGVDGQHWLVTSHDTRQAAIGKASTTERDHGQMSKATIGPHPLSSVTAAVAADLALYPDFDQGFKIVQSPTGHDAKGIREMYARMESFVNTSTATASTDGARRTTILACRQGMKLHGVALTFDMAEITRSTDFHRHAVRVLVPHADAAGESALLVHVPFTTSTDDRVRKGMKHLYVGDGEAEVKTVFVMKARQGDSSHVVQVLEFVSDHAIRRVLVNGNIGSVSYLQSHTYMTRAPAVDVYKELGAFTGHTVFLNYAGAFSRGTSVQFNHSDGFTPTVTASRISHALAESVNTDSCYEHLRGFLSNFAHHSKTFHTTVTVVVDETFWGAALDGLDIDDGATLSQPLGLLFLLRGIAGRAIRIVDATDHGHGDLCRVLTHLAVHADSWPWLYLAHALRQSRGSMAFVPSTRMLHLDHRSHHEIGTGALEHALSEYTRLLDATSDDPSQETRVTLGRHRGSSRALLVVQLVTRAARSCGFLRFPVSARWDQVDAPRARPGTMVKDVVVQRTWAMTCPRLVSTTYDILQHAASASNLGSGDVFEFCVAANFLLTQFLISTQPNLKRGSGVSTRLASSRATYLSPMRDAVIQAVKQCVDQKRPQGEVLPDWLPEFLEFLQTRPEVEGVCTTSVLSRDVQERPPTEHDRWFVAPDTTTDLEFVLNTSSDIHMAGTGVFSMVVLNTLLHEMLLTRVCLPPSYTVSFGHALPVEQMKQLRDALLQTKNTAAYAPRWYAQYSADTPKKHRHSFEIFLRASLDERKTASANVWSPISLPWWIIAERALGYRVALQQVPSGWWDARQPAENSGGAPAPLYTAGQFVKKIVMRASDRPDDPRASVVDSSVADSQEFTWGRRGVIMLTLLSLTFLYTAKSM